MKPRTESNMSSPVVVGVDIGEEVFHLVGFAADGKIAFRRRIKRLALKDVFEKLPQEDSASGSPDVSGLRCVHSHGRNAQVGGDTYAVL
jgi:hypothetical protein